MIEREGKINKLTLEEQLKLRAAQQKAIEDPAVKAAIEKRNQAIQEFRQALTTAWSRVIPRWKRSWPKLPSRTPRFLIASSRRNHGRERPRAKIRSLEQLASDKSGRFPQPFIPSFSCDMSDLNGPKKETVRITLPPRVPPGGSGSGTSRISLPAQYANRHRGARATHSSSAATAFTSTSSPAAATAALTPPRTQSPAITPVAPPVAPVTPPTAPDAASTTRVASAPARALTQREQRHCFGRSLTLPGLRHPERTAKETARITIRPEPAAPMAATVKMAKTQPLLTVPAAKAPSAPVFVAEEEEEAETEPPGLLDMLDHVPLPVCWTIFAISSVTLLIQIWNYVSS